MQEADIDSIKGALNDLMRKQKETENSVDSLKDKFIPDNFFISVKAAKETQELYNTSFSNMQTSFNIFIAALGVLVLVFSWFNSKTTSDLRKDAKDDLKKFESKIEELSRKSDIIDEKMKNYNERAEMQQKTINDIMKNSKSIDNKDDKEKIALKKKANDVMNDPNASPYEKALAKAAEYYYSDDYENTLKSYEIILKDYKNEITLTRLSQIYFQMAYSYTEIKPHSEELFNQAIDKYKEALKWDPKNAKASYNLACLYALEYGSTKNLSSEEAAFKYLEEALENKERDKGLSFDYVEKDQDLAPLNKNDYRYKELKDKYG